MTFKLSKQLDSLKNPALFFDIYEQYIIDNANKFPESVTNLIRNPRWYGGSDSDAPYYSVLKSFSISDLGKDSASIILRLIKKEYVSDPIQIDILYKGVCRIDIPDQSFVTEHSLKWRYEQFLYYDSHINHDIKTPMFTHQIEWVNGKVWSISAKDIEVVWGK